MPSEAHIGRLKPNHRNFSTSLRCSRPRVGQCRGMSSSSGQSYKITNAVSAIDCFVSNTPFSRVCWLLQHGADVFVRRQIVLGGSSGIGFSICEEFLRSGAKVLSLSRSTTVAEGAQHVHCDLSSHASIMAAAAAVSSIYGGTPTPITLVLNAGHGKSDSAHSVTQESLQQHLNINVVSQVLHAGSALVDVSRCTQPPETPVCAVHFHRSSASVASTHFEHHLDRLHVV
jgi:hypothetical protein